MSRSPDYNGPPYRRRSRSPPGPRMMDGYGPHPFVGRFGGRGRGRGDRDGDFPPFGGRAPYRPFRGFRPYGFMGRGGRGFDGPPFRGGGRFDDRGYRRRPMGRAYGPPRGRGRFGGDRSGSRSPPQPRFEHEHEGGGRYRYDHDDARSGDWRYDGPPYKNDYGPGDGPPRRPRPYMPRYGQDDFQDSGRDSYERDRYNGGRGRDDYHDRGSRGRDGWVGRWDGDERGKRGGDGEWEGGGRRSGRRSESPSRWARGREKRDRDGGGREEGKRYSERKYSDYSSDSCSEDSRSKDGGRERHRGGDGGRQNGPAKGYDDDTSTSDWGGGCNSKQQNDQDKEEQSLQAQQNKTSKQGSEKLSTEKQQQSEQTQEKLQKEKSQVQNQQNSQQQQQTQQNQPLQQLDQQHQQEQAGIQPNETTAHQNNVHNEDAEDSCYPVEDDQDNNLTNDTIQAQQQYTYNTQRTQGADAQQRNGDAQQNGGDVLKCVSQGVDVKQIQHDEKVWYYVDPEGTQQGPCSLKKFMRWLTTMQQKDMQAEIQDFLLVHVWMDGAPGTCTLRQLMDVVNSP